MRPTLPALSSKNLVSAPMKRSQMGLYHGSVKQYGNNNPFSKTKTRRIWLPNVHSKVFDSEALQRRVKIDVTTTALRTMDKVRCVACLCVLKGVADVYDGT